MPSQVTLLGVGSALSSALLWAYASVLFRPIVAQHGAIPTNLFKATLGAVLFGLTAVVMAGFRGGFPTGGDRGDYGQLLLSGVIGLAIGDACYFAAMKRVGVRQATLLHGTAPLWLLIINWLGFSAPLSTVRVLGILAVTAGVLDVTRARTADPHTPLPKYGSGVAFGIGAAMSQALGILTAKSATDRIDSVSMVAGVRLTGAVITMAIALLAMRRWRAGTLLFRDPVDRRRAALPAFIGTYCGILGMTLAIRTTHTAVAGALLSLTPVFAIPVTWWVQGEPIRPRTLLGTLVACAGVALICLGSD